MAQLPNASSQICKKEAVFVGGLFYIYTLYSFELPETKNCISALFPGLVYRLGLVPLKHF